MKSKERHKLKENEFARTVAHASDLLQTRGRDMVTLTVVIVVALALAGGFSWWRQARNAKANALLAAALSVEEAPVIAPTAPARRARSMIASMRCVGIAGWRER